MTEAVTPATDARIKCAICGALVHSIQHHLNHEHKDLGMTLETYQEVHPGQPIMSDLAAKKIDDLMKAKAAKLAKEVSTDSVVRTTETVKLAFHEVFSLGSGAAAMGASGRPIPVTVLGENAEFSNMIPDIDPNYLFNVEVLKTLMMGRADRRAHPPPILSRSAHREHGRRAHRRGLAPARRQNLL